MENEFTEKMLNEIIKYVCAEVNWIEACTIYAEKHEIDYETLGEVIRGCPKLLAEVTTTARDSRVVNIDYATLPI